MTKRLEKLCSLAEAMALIEDGMRIAFGGFAVYQKPMAAVHEIIRTKKKNLTLVGAVESIDADMLIGAGCVSHIETSYVGLEKFGLARNFKRAMETGSLKIAYYPELLSWDRFCADRSGMTFWPVNFLGGSDIVNKNPDIIPFKCPLTGKQLWAVPAANVDVAVVHVHMADKYGNVQIQDRHTVPQGFIEAVAQSCSTVIVTAEHIVSNDVIRQTPHLTILPAYKTTCVVEARYGSHPTPTLNETHTDNDFFRLYAKAIEQEDTFREFLNKYIYGTKMLEEYIALVGADQVAALEVK